ncbi:MAG: YafY family protein [Pseudomonadota bacterium]
MTRSERLLAILQALRGRRRAITAAALAQRFGVSERSIYRDIATLNLQGARIEGSAGIGYVLREGFFLPPLAFDADEAAALLLGLRFVLRRGDAGLVRGAESARAKLAEVLPAAFGDAAGADVPLLVAPPSARSDTLGVLRRAIGQQQVLRIRYSDSGGRRTERRLWPVALGWFEGVEMVAAWCERRGAFRNFRVDRIRHIEPLDERPPRSRRSLLAEYRRIEPGLQL